jgi:hypothetical protein
MEDAMEETPNNEPENNEPNPEEPPEETKPEDGKGDEQKPAEEKKSYTDAELNALIQKRLARDRVRFEKELREKIANESKSQEDEAQKLRNMTDLQRAQYEARKLKEQNEALLAEKSLSEQMNIARKELSAEGINLGDELLSMFVAADADTTNTALEKIKEIWPKAVNAAVQETLKRTPPAAEKKSGSKSFGAAFAEKYNNQANQNQGGK